MLRRFQANTTTSSVSVVIVATAPPLLSSAARLQAGPGGGPGPASAGGASNPVPAYKKPPAAPAGTHLRAHVGGGTGPKDPIVRRDPNQPTRAPESSVLSTQGGVLLTQQERSDPRLLSDRRLPLGEWLRKTAAAGTNSSSSLLQTYLASLMLPPRGPPLGQAQQEAISRFEEETIAEASVNMSREPGIEKARWHAVARKFTAELHVFDPARFEAELDEGDLKKQVMNFFDGDASYDKEVSEVFAILRDNAIAVRNHTIKELAAAVAQSAALEEGGLVWERFFSVVEGAETKAKLMQMCCSSQQQLLALEAMWHQVTREQAPPLLSPALALLFISTTAQGTAPKAPGLKRLLEAQMTSGGSGVDSDALWAPGTGAVDRFVTKDELFRFVSKNLSGFLSQMDQGVVDDLRAAGFRQLADEAANAAMEKVTATAIVDTRKNKNQQQQQQQSAAQKKSGGGATTRQQLVTDIVSAFKRIGDAHSAVQSIVQMSAASRPIPSASAPTAAASSSSSSPTMVTTTVRGFILELLQTLVPPERRTAAMMTNLNKSSSSSSSRGGGGYSSTDLKPLFAALESSWDVVHQKFTVSLLSNVHATKLLAESVNIKSMSAGSARTQELMQNVWTSEKVKTALSKLVSLDAATQERTEAAVKNIRVRLLSQPSGEIARCARMILRAQQRGNTKSSSGDNNEILSLIRARIARATSESATWPQWLSSSVVQQVAQEFPSWTASSTAPVITAGDLSGNYSSSASSSSSSSYLSTDEEALHRHALLFRIYLRLTYVPHAANAVLKSRHRRRIGPLATKPHQFNLEAEVGFAEEYNGTDHKQWDWQGWYQRMMDVFHRNVSMRVRVSDMRGRLDSSGRPFVDLQTERRLRVLAGERVGGGVLKLDSDRFEDRSDNLDYGTGKLQQLLSEAKKAQLGREYWPTVEVKVREPSGQSKLHYSLLDWDRVEAKSAEMLDKYKAAKERSIYVSPTATWLEVGSGAGATKTSSATVDDDGYTVDVAAPGAKNKK